MMDTMEAGKEAGIVKQESTEVSKNYSSEKRELFMNAKY